MTGKPRSLTIPYAVDGEGRLVSPAAASRAREYRCPQCERPLILRAGRVRTNHFAHPANDACHPETLRHLLAKRLVAQVVNEWRLNGGPAPTVFRTCSGCGGVVPHPLPERVARAVVEHRVGGRWIVDVAFLNSGGQVIAAIEILATHAVSQEKAKDLSVPAAELRAEHVLESPLEWRPLPGLARPYVCDACKAARIAAELHLHEVASRNGQPLPGLPYRAATYTCWRCRNETVVYSWKGHVPFTRDLPPSPRPPTLRLTYSRTIRRRYWANNCAICGSIQGDNFLFFEPDGPFFGEASDILDADDDMAAQDGEAFGL